MHADADAEYFTLHFSKMLLLYGIDQWTDLEKDKKITRQLSESLHIAMRFYLETNISLQCKCVLSLTF